MKTFTLSVAISLTALFTNAKSISLVTGSSINFNNISISKGEAPLSNSIKVFQSSINCKFGKTNNNTVLLNWVTPQAINNNHFEVEQSFDNTNFKTIGLVLDGIETSASERDYLYKDNSTKLLQNKVVYYRLKQIDNDGSVTYSKTIPVKLNTNNTISSNNP